MSDFNWQKPSDFALDYLDRELFSIATTGALSREERIARVQKIADEQAGEGKEMALGYLSVLKLGM